MVNYIQDLVKRLARYYGEQYDQPNCYRNIEVGHYHRIFPLKKEKTEGDQTEKQPILDNRNVKEPVEVLLIDEGQDFERAWVDNLLKLCGLNYEFMLCEDRRQNIYGREEIKAEAMPIPGRPSELKESFRIPEQTAKLANFISDYTKLEVTEVVESIKPNQGNLFVRNLWFNGTETKAIKALEADIKSLTKDGNNARPDIAILVCTVEDGWKTCQLLNLLKLPYQSSFESEEESKRLKKMYPDKKEFKKFRDQVRRGYKAGFWMQGGKIKVATIHSFKGWELSNILVFFHPSEEKQGKNRVELLYTAITRSQECLTIYNLDPLFDKFGDVAIAEGYIQRHPLQSTSA